MHLRTFFIIPLLICSSFIPLAAQEEERSVSRSFDTWWSNINTYDLSEKWYLSSEVHVRRTEGLDRWRQLLLRPAVNYRVQEHVDFAAGYSYIRSYPFQKGALDHVIEHNVWEQVTLGGTTPYFSHSHRYRLEHRFIDAPGLNEAGNVVYENKRKQRFRYRFTVNIPLSDDGRFSVTLFDELWMDLFDDLTPVGMDKNWAYAGLDYAFSDNGKFGLGYMHHWALAGEGSYASANVIQTTLFFDLDFSKENEAIGEE